MLDGFTAARWTPLEDERGPRLLVSDGERTVVVAVFDSSQAITAEAEKLASAILRTILPTERSFRVPRVLASRSFRPGQLAEDELYVAISEPLDGAPMSTEDFITVPGLVDSLAEVLAVLHSAETGPIADAGLVVHEPQEVRSLLWDLLDRGAATGRVPSELLERWETVLETPALWHFLPVPLHGDLSIDALRTDGRAIASLSDFGSLRVGDPAVDLEAVSHLLEPEDFGRFLTVYAQHARHDDPGLRQRIDLRSEMAVLELLLAAVDSEDEDEIADVEEMLTDLAELIAPADQPRAQDTAAPSAGEDEPSEPRRPEPPRAEVPAAEDDAPDAAAQSQSNDSGLRPLSFGESDDDGESTDVISR